VTRVLTGLDLLPQSSIDKMKRVGLLTTSAAVNMQCCSSIEVVKETCNLVALFAPEHGLYSNVQDAIAISDKIDPITGVPIYSLYGQVRKPTAEMLKNIDLLIYDIPDTGVRFYTYIYTMAYTMEACAACGVPMLILDRPNPLGGEKVFGTILQEQFASFVGRFPLPVQYALTPAELAEYFNETYKIGCELQVLKMTGWRRNMYFDDTGLHFINPSPNIPTFNTVLTYPATCYLEGTNVSEGRGTTRPFEYLGAPWINPHELAQALTNLSIPGVFFRPLWFEPFFGRYNAEQCGGVHVVVVNREIFNPFNTGLLLLTTLEELYPKQFQWTDYPEIPGSFYTDYLLGTDAFRKRKIGTKELIMQAVSESEAYKQLATNYYLYE